MTRQQIDELLRDLDYEWRHADNEGKLEIIRKVLFTMLEDLK